MDKFKALFNIDKKYDKSEMHKILKNWSENIFEIVEENFEKPWGGYFKFKENKVKNFVDKFFGSDFLIDKEFAEYRLDPKILVVAPNKRLSWQYHFRRAEYWKVLFGRVSVWKNKSNEFPRKKPIYKTGDLVKLDKKIRHRLVGLNSWGIVAEIWVHTETGNPSNEEDIVRVSDDFGR